MAKRKNSGGKTVSAPSRPQIKQNGLPKTRSVGTARKSR